MVRSEDKFKEIGKYMAKKSAGLAAETAAGKIPVVKKQAAKVIKKAPVVTKRAAGAVKKAGKTLKSLKK